MISALVSFLTTPTATLAPTPAAPPPSAPSTDRTSRALVADTFTDCEALADGVLLLISAPPATRAIVSEFRTSTLTAPAMPAKVPPAALAPTARMSSLDRATTATPTISRTLNLPWSSRKSPSSSWPPVGIPDSRPVPLPPASTTAPPPITASVVLVMTVTTIAPAPPPPLTPRPTAPAIE